MKPKTALTRNLLRRHFVLHDPRITVACNSTKKFHVKNPASKNSEFVARSVHKSVLSVHSTLTVEFQRTGLLHFPTTQLRGTHYITLRAPSVRKEPVCASWHWQAPCAMRHCYITEAHKNVVVFIYKPNKFCWEAWHCRVTGESETKGGPEISGLAYLAISENNNMATWQDYTNTDYSMDSVKQRKQMISTSRCVPHGNRHHVAILLPPYDLPITQQSPGML